jgi:hypothetical protein
MQAHVRRGTFAPSQTRETVSVQVPGYLAPLSREYSSRTASISYYYLNQHFARGRASTLSRYLHQALAQAGGPSVFRAHTEADPQRGKAPFPGYNAGHEPEGGGVDARVFLIS